MKDDFTRVECEIAGRPLTIETGRVARQAHGSTFVQYGETQCFAAASVGPARDDLDFFPLTVDYREKTEAAGKIPGGFFKREGRPTTKEILTMRLIDRSIRPMFPNGFKPGGPGDDARRCSATTVTNNTDVLAMIAAFAALHISGDPVRGRWARSASGTSTASSGAPSADDSTARATSRASTWSWPVTRTAIAMVEASGLGADRGRDDRRPRAGPRHDPSRSSIWSTS